MEPLQHHNPSSASRAARGGVSGEAGFTLVELLVVSVLLAILASILYGAINGILQGRAIIESERDTGRVAQYVLERMERELTARVLSPVTAPDPGSGGRNPIGSRAYLVGENGGSDREERDRLRFVSSNAAQAQFAAAPNFGLVEVEYRLEESKESFAADGGSDAKLSGMMLIREEMPAEVPEKKIAEARRAIFPLAYDVVALNFRYLKDGKWQDEWKEQVARLPEAVEVRLTLRAGGDRVEHYQTAFGISRPVRR